MRRLGESVLMAVGIAALATVLAFPLAYFLTFRAGSRAPLFLTLLLIPFAVSYLLRVMAWKLMLGPEGGINSLLGTLGLTDEPIGLLLYSRPAVIITLVYVWVPFATLPIYAAMQRIDRGHLEAAADLGAGPWSRFWRITVPLSIPGALATFFMVFIPTVGRVRHALAGGRDRRNHVRQHHPGLLHALRELADGSRDGHGHARPDPASWWRSRCAWWTCAG